MPWRAAKPALAELSSFQGAAVGCGDTVYVSCEYSVYTYSLQEDTWSTLPQYTRKYFSLAVVKRKLTAIGGLLRDAIAAESLMSLCGDKWEKVLPSMPTGRMNPAALMIGETHLVVAGGSLKPFATYLPIVEVLDTLNLQWSTASNLPLPLLQTYPQMALCDGFLYVSANNRAFSCSLLSLLAPPPPSAKHGLDKSAWTRLCDIPVVYGSSLVTHRGRMLSIGGATSVLGAKATGIIYCFNVFSQSWDVLGAIPTPRSRILATVLPNNELMVIGGKSTQGTCRVNEIGFLS